MKTNMIIDIINNMYDQLVDDNYSFKTFQKNEGIYFKLNISSHCFGFERDGNTYHEDWEHNVYAEVHIIILNGRKVFINTSSDVYSFNIPQTNWTNTSNHDSCWRDGCRSINQIARDVVEQAYSKCPKEHVYGSYDDRVDIRFAHNLFGTVFKFVNVNLQADIERDPTGYFYNIGDVKQIEKTITVA